MIFETPNSPELGWRNPFIDTRSSASACSTASTRCFKTSIVPWFYTWDKSILRDYCEFGTRLNAEGKRELKCKPGVSSVLYETSRDFDGLGRIVRAEVPLLVLFGDK